MTEYTFDVKLFATLRVKVDTEAQALAILRDCFEDADCNGGAWPDGSPILFSAGVDGDADLIEVDGEAV